MLDENTKFDFKKLHKALSTTYKRQMEIKKEFPHRFERPSYGALYKKEMALRKPWMEARAEFDSLSKRMTMLCCIINHAKGKLHMSYWDGETFTKEDQEEYIYNSYEEFELKDDEIVVEEYIKEHTLKPKKSVIARFAEALGL